MSMRARMARSIVFSAALACGAHALHAQQTPLGAWSNHNGSLQATVTSRLDLGFFAPQSTPPLLIPETEPFIAPRASIFGEFFAASSLYVLSELRVDRGEEPAAGALDPRLEQIFVRYAAAPALALQAGKFVTPFGDYPQRHANAGEAFIRPPMPYDWPTLVTPSSIPGSNNGFIGWKDQPEIFRPQGVPPVWGVPYQVGAMAFGTHRRASYRIAVMNSAPSSEPGEWNSVRNLARRPSFAGAFSLQVSPDLRAGLSADYGPYMREVPATASLPPGESIDEFTQTLVGLNATYAREHVDIHAEAMYDRWYVPNVIDRPTDYSVYVESKLKLSPGLFVAGRVAHIAFNRIALTPSTVAPGADTKSAWDYPCSRFEVAGGYRFTTSLSMRAQYGWTLQSRPRDLPDNLFSIDFRFDR